MGQASCHMLSAIPRGFCSSRVFERETAPLNAPGVQNFAYEEKGPCVCVSQYKDERLVKVIVQGKGEAGRLEPWAGCGACPILVPLEARAMFHLGKFNRFACDLAKVGRIKQGLQFCRN